MLLKNSGGFEARDPSVIFYKGNYYHCYTKDAQAIYISKSKTIEGLFCAEETLVYTPKPNQDYSKELWAPELHVLNGVCYIYVACDNGDNYNHRMYVLTNDTDNPLNTYRLIGKVADESNKWAIDGTVFEYDKQLYFVWSGWEGDVNVCQNLYIAKMSNPYTISSKRVMISTPEHAWEKMNCDGVNYPFINEGPCAFIKDGKLKIIFSASGSWANNYCLGILELIGKDLLDVRSWKKQEFPALSSDDGLNGPGHSTVFKSGDKDYIAFHVYDDGRTSGWDNVHAIISPFEIKNGKIVLE